MNAWHMLGPICWLYADNSRHISTYGRHDTQRVTKFLESWAHHEVCDEVTRGIHPLIPLNRRSSAQGHQNSDTHKQKEQRNRKEKRKLHPGEAQTKTEHGIREIRRQRCDTHGGSETEVTVTSKLHAQVQYREQRNRVKSETFSDQWHVRVYSHAAGSWSRSHPF